MVSECEGRLFSRRDEARLLQGPVGGKRVARAHSPRTSSELGGCRADHHRPGIHLGQRHLSGWPETPGELRPFRESGYLGAPRRGGRYEPVDNESHGRWARKMVAGRTGDCLPVTPQRKPGSLGDARGRGSRPATDFRPRTELPRVVVSGRKEIAFTSYRSGNAEIWVVSADGGEPRQVTDQRGARGAARAHQSAKRSRHGQGHARIGAEDTRVPHGTAFAGASSVDEGDAKACLCRYKAQQMPTIPAPITVASRDALVCDTTWTPAHAPDHTKYPILYAMTRFPREPSHVARIVDA